MRANELSNEQRMGGRYLRIPQIIHKYGIKRSAIYSLLPPPIKVGGASLWIEDELDAFMRGRIEASRGAAAEQRSA
jgi:predicted DNA-binding transcriptional regulator AlpA